MGISPPTNKLPQSQRVRLPMTRGDSEAQLEAQLRAAILRAFPWLPANEVKHQTSFTFQLGHNTITINGTERSSVRARADVLVSLRGTPLAVFELKRDGETLTAEDEAQCLSYARVLHPRPPLAVVTNGTKTVVLETHTGKPWSPATPSEAELSALVQSASHAASVDLKQAVNTLMGQDPDVWMQAVRAVTRDAFAEKMGGWDSSDPFVDVFLIPRRVADQCRRLLEDKRRLVVITGEPLSGKSSVLRELAGRAELSADLVTLYLDADVGINIFERLAQVLATALDWPVADEEARHWLQQLSRGSGPALVVLIDNVGPGRDDLRRNLETLSSNMFGPNLRLVLAVDDTVAAEMGRNRQARGPSAFAKRAAVLPLGPLDNEEFEKARNALAPLRIAFVDGAQHSEELRAPWVIRAMAADAATTDGYDKTDWVAGLSPVPGLELIDFARRTFDVTRSPLNHYRELAIAILEDAQDRDKGPELVLELLQTFIVRRATALKHLSEAELQDMGTKGLVREARSHSGDNIYVVRIPELMASELAALVADQLASLSTGDPVTAAEFLVTAANSLPLGDIIVAEAIGSTAIKARGLNFWIIAELRKRPPRHEPFSPGTRGAGYVPGVGHVEFVFGEDGKVTAQSDGHVIQLSGDDTAGGDQQAIVDIHPYLILAHLAGHPLLVRPKDTNQEVRADPDLLIGVGSTPIILRRPYTDPEVGSVTAHDIGGDMTIVCHAAGVVEAITWSLVRFFGREDEAMCDQFLDEALAQPHPALLARLDIALRQTAGYADKARAGWAQHVRRHRLTPLLDAHVKGFRH